MGSAYTVESVCNRLHWIDAYLQHCYLCGRRCCVLCWVFSYCWLSSNLGYTLSMYHYRTFFIYYLFWHCTDPPITLPKIEYVGWRAFQKCIFFSFCNATLLCKVIVVDVLISLKCFVVLTCLNCIQWTVCTTKSSTVCSRFNFSVCSQSNKSTKPLCPSIMSPLSTSVPV